jgi:hypothetical protein
MKEGTSSKWYWAHDGSNTNGVIEFLSDGGVKWDDGDRHGNWKLRDDGTLLETSFNNIYHELRYVNGKAILIVPSRSPQSTMT